MLFEVKTIEAQAFGYLGGFLTVTMVLRALFDDGVQTVVHLRDAVRAAQLDRDARNKERAQ